MTTEVGAGSESNHKQKNSASQMILATDDERIGATKDGIEPPNLINRHGSQSNFSETSSKKALALKTNAKNSMNAQVKP